jgi:hypothetical protein
MFYIDEIRRFYPDATYQSLLDQVIFVVIGAVVASWLLTLLLVPDRPWPHIYLKYNRRAIQAAEEAGAPLIPPSPTEEELEAARREHDGYVTSVGSFSMSDYVLFGAATLLVFGMAFKQDVTVYLGALLIFCAKVRIMLYGMARFGVWQGCVFYLGATAAILAILAYGDGNLWNWLASAL